MSFDKKELKKLIDGRELKGTEDLYDITYLYADCANLLP